MESVKAREPGLRVTLWIVASMAATAAAPGAAAPPATAPSRTPWSDYEALFGDEERRVAATPTTKDDASFAIELVAKAGSLTDEPGLVHVMYEKAFEYGSKDPAGYAAAADSARRLAAAEPTSQWGEKLVELYEIQVKHGTGQERSDAGDALISAFLDDASNLLRDKKYADALKRCRDATSIASAVRSSRADEIAALANEIRARQAAVAKVERLRFRLKDEPRNQALRTQIIGIYLFEIDDAASAASFAGASGDPSAAVLALLAKDAGALSEGEVLSLARWYKRVGEKLDPPSRAIALCDALTYYQRYLDGHSQKDAERLKAGQEADEGTAALSALHEGVTADRLVLWNTHNGPGNDRGAAVTNVVLLLRGAPVWTRSHVQMPWAAAQDSSLALALPPTTRFDAVRVEVTEWHQWGGGLAEIEVFRGSRDIARGMPASASASFDEPTGPANLTDGVTSSANFRTGYWLLPNKAPGWAEVDLAKPRAR